LISLPFHFSEETVPREVTRDNKSRPITQRRIFQTNQTQQLKNAITNFALSVVEG